MEKHLPKKPALANFKDLLAAKETLRLRFKEGEPYRPIDAEIRINWRCNAACEMCGLDRYMESQDSFRRKEMSTEDAVSVLDQLAALGCRRVTISGGEPSLHKGLETIVSHAANDLGLWVALNSNGSLLKPKRLSSILEAGLGQVTFSLDSPEAAVHDKVRRMPGNHARISQCIRQIHDHYSGRRRQTQICINTVLLRETILTVGGFAEFYAEAPFDYLTLSPASIGTEWDDWTATDQDLRPSLEDVLAFKSEIIPALQRSLPTVHISDPYGDTAKEIHRNLHVEFDHGMTQCHVPMFHTVVQSNGNIIPCCYAPDSYTMGNALVGGLATAWNGEPYADFRAGCRSGGLFPMCKSCRQYVYLNRAVDGIIHEAETVS